MRVLNVVVVSIVSKC